VKKASPRPDAGIRGQEIIEAERKQHWWRPFSASDLWEAGIFGLQRIRRRFAEGRLAGILSRWAAWVNRTATCSSHTVARIWVTISAEAFSTACPLHNFASA